MRTAIWRKPGRDPAQAVFWGVDAIGAALGLALEREMEAVGDEMLARAQRAGFA